MGIKKSLLITGLAAGLMFIAYSSAGIISAAGKNPDKTIGAVKFVFIESGSFNMGSPDNAGYLNERPRRRVSLNSYWISKYEITRAQYEAVMKTNPGSSEFRGNNNRPVDQVSWNDAMEFCRKFSEINGVQVRLPYEAEWENARRAGTETLYFWGDKFNPEYAWYHDNSNDLTYSAGSRKPNRWGLFDMSGNVAEWCMDWYADDYYSSGPAANPTGPKSGKSRVIRGGSWFHNSYEQRSGLRLQAPPEMKNFYTGFRIAAEKL